MFLKIYDYVFLVVAVFLSGCGFEPLYKNPDSLHNESKNISNIDIVVHGEGYKTQYFRQLIHAKSYYLKAPKNYKVKLYLSENKRDIGYSKQGTALTTQLDFLVEYEIFDQITGNLVVKDNLRGSTSFQVNPDQEYINFNAYQGAQERLVSSLCNDVVRDLAYLLNHVEHTN